jgi:anti-sigma B factor antagonist
MQIEERAIGTVTVLDIKGKVTLDEGDQMLRDTIGSLVERRRFDIVIDLKEVTYIDSAGNGAFARTYTTVSRRGGTVVFCNLSKRIADLWTITKLLTVYETYDSREEAVRSFEGPRFEAACPVCRPLSWTSDPVGRRLLSCTVCDCRFFPDLTPTLLAPLDREDSPAAFVNARVSNLWWITYYENSYGHEAVQVKLGRPCTIVVSGRLDLFAFDVVQRAWEAVPPPRRVVFDTKWVRLFSEVGRAKLVELCLGGDGSDRAAIVSQNHWPTASPAVFADWKAAAEALGDSGNMPQSIEVRVRRRG